MKFDVVLLSGSHIGHEFWMLDQKLLIDSHLALFLCDDASDSWLHSVAYLRCLRGDRHPCDAASLDGDEMQLGRLQSRDVLSSFLHGGPLVSYSLHLGSGLFVFSAEPRLVSLFFNFFVVKLNLIWAHHGVALVFVALFWGVSLVWFIDSLLQCSTSNQKALP